MGVAHHGCLKIHRDMTLKFRIQRFNFTGELSANQHPDRKILVEEVSPVIGLCDPFLKGGSIAQFHGFNRR